MFYLIFANIVSILFFTSTLLNVPFSNLFLKVYLWVMNSDFHQLLCIEVFFPPLGPSITKSSFIALICFVLFLRPVTNNLCYWYLLTYVGSESLFYKVIVVHLIKIEQDSVWNK